MGRHPRPDLPGRAFHITTRLQDHAHRFTPVLRDRVVHLLGRHIQRSDVRLLAYAVMTNHLHLVLVQGLQPLEALMQPFLRSVALAVQNADGVEGHVFERRFRDTVCKDGRHLRNAIAYTHANPVTAGLCTAPGDYLWSSHPQYDPAVTRVHRPRVPVDVDTGLGIFMPHHPAAPALGCAAGWDGYRDHLARVLTEPSALDEETDDEPGDRADTSRVPNGSQVTGDGRVPIARIASDILQRAGLSIPFEGITSRWGPRWKSRVRREIAHAASRAGYSNREIADCLRLSQSAVSRMLSVPPGS